jgi:hypothetical protein
MGSVADHHGPLARRPSKLSVSTVLLVRPGEHCRGAVGLTNGIALPSESIALTQAMAQVGASHAVTYESERSSGRRVTQLQHALSNRAVIEQAETRLPPSSV